MTEHTTRRQVLAVAGAGAVTALAGCSGSGGGSSDAMETEESMDDGSMDNESMDDTEDEMMSGPVAVTVRIENVAVTDFYPADTSTGGQIWFTPGAFAVHTGENPIFTAGESASAGLEAQAEAGPPTGFPDEPGLVDELDRMLEDGVVSAGAFTPENTVADPNDPTGEMPGAPPIAPGGAFEFDIEAEPGARLSFASMFVPSNDVFVAPGADGIALWPEDGEPTEGDVTDAIQLWDAGTEPNGEPPGTGPDQAPAQNASDQGADEGSVVRPLTDVNDGYDYPAVSEALRVTLTP